MPCAIRCLAWELASLGTSIHIPQCLTGGNAFLKLYINDYNCNKSCLGTYFSRLVPLSCCPVPFFPANLVPNYLKMCDLGKGVVELLQSFYLFVAASWEVHKAPLKLERQALSCLSQWLCWKPFPASFHCHCDKFHCTKWWVAGPASFGPRLNPCLWRACSCTC